MRRPGILITILLALCLGASSCQGIIKFKDSKKGVRYLGREKLGFRIITNKSVIEGELYPSAAPNTVLNFVTLARKGFYDGLTFHRVVPGFVIQTGDPRGDGTGGPGYHIPAEINNKSHKIGALGMARSKHPDSAGSQFYICISNCSQLDGKYTVFGRVKRGIDTCLLIEKGDKIRKLEITGELPPELKGKKIKKSNLGRLK